MDTKMSLSDPNVINSLPVIDPDSEELKRLTDFPDNLSILPIKNTVLFPGIIMPITVGRKKSIYTIRNIETEKNIIGVLTQKNRDVEDPIFKNLPLYGTIGKILKKVQLPNGNITILIQGLNRFEVISVLQENPRLLCEYKILKNKKSGLIPEEKKALLLKLKKMADEIMSGNPEIPKELRSTIEKIKNVEYLVDFLASNILESTEEKQKILEINKLKDKITKLQIQLNKILQVIPIKNEIQEKVHTDIDQQQRDYYLRNQIKVLQNELGEDSPEGDIEEFKKKGEEKNWNEEVKLHFEKELKKITRMNSSSAEYPVLYNYLELLIELPWKQMTEDNYDLRNAQKILDRDHFGLTKVKERIIEYLSVQKLKQNLKGPVLCLFGPPGVGKTSLGKSIANSLNRKYVRISLGGLHDESEIRGHRKTYIGAMPGKIVQGIKKAKSSNPVFILDEIDKIGSDFRGDPSSALLEVLDSQQNNTFKDNYLEVEYDLSKVLFIATANSLDTIQPALRDRLEMIEINGYTNEEKKEIAKKYLIPKQIEEHGLLPKQIKISPLATHKIIEEYTRESGVRGLDRKIAAITRNVAKSIALEEDYKKIITPKEVRSILGIEPFEKDKYENNNIPGVVTGLAWTPVGGDILFIESSLSKGKGKLTLSGKLGEVMKESAITALSHLKSHAETLGIDHNIFDQYDLHIHVPAGAIPKDGPSAGITMYISLASIYTQRKVKKRIAMTGEITLRGRVLPVGGIKEKTLAAKRAGIEEIILCKKNRKDIEEIGNDYTKGIQFHFIDFASEALDVALTSEKPKNYLKFILKKETI